MRKETDLSGIKALGHAMLNTDGRQPPLYQQRHNRSA